jgi:hypothetical protein
MEECLAILAFQSHVVCLLLLVDVETVDVHFGKAKRHAQRACLEWRHQIDRVVPANTRQGSASPSSSSSSSAAAAAAAEGALDIESSF